MSGYIAAMSTEMCNSEILARESFLFQGNPVKELTYVPGSKLPLFPYNRGWFINPIVGVYIPIIRIPIEGGMTIPNIATFDHGTYCDLSSGWNILST